MDLSHSGRHRNKNILRRAALFLRIIILVWRDIYKEYNMGVSINGGIQKCWFISWNIPSTNGWFGGVPLFQETTVYYQNTNQFLQCFEACKKTHTHNPWRLWIYDLHVLKNACPASLPDWYWMACLQIDANCISILCCLSPFLSFTGATRPDRLIIWDEWSPEYQEHIQIFQIAKELVKQTLNLPTMPNHTSQTLPTNSTNLIAPLHWINHPELNQLTVTYPTFNYI